MDKSDQSDQSDDDQSVNPAEPLATNRSRRANAGSRMNQLIQEEEDEFYTQIYGGFNEEDDDGDFNEEEDVDEDELEDDYDVDSDFSIDETDEIAPEHQVAEEEPKRKKKSVYKDPRPVSGPSSSTPVQSKTKPSSSQSHRPERMFRDSTKKKTAETLKAMEMESRKRKRSKNTIAPRKLTQEETLEEAKITEEENIKSLEIYQRLESEKLQKIKLTKKALNTPYVTYYSSVFCNPESKERYTRNLCIYVGCEPQSKNTKRQPK